MLFFCVVIPLLFGLDADNDAGRIRTRHADRISAGDEALRVRAASYTAPTGQCCTQAMKAAQVDDVRCHTGIYGARLFGCADPMSAKEADLDCIGHPDALTSRSPQSVIRYHHYATSPSLKALVCRDIAMERTNVRMLPRPAMHGRQTS